jgi:hypothetical protein
MKRRRFLFWLSFGMFTLAEKWGFIGLDKLAAATIDLADPTGETPPSDASSAATANPPEHWTAAENNNWRWYEREIYVDGQWKTNGITTPVNKETGELYTDAAGYLDVAAVPEKLKVGKVPVFSFDADDASVQAKEHKPNPTFLARHGRPPSKWLRSLNAGELRIWLKTIDPPEAGVEGMTYWTHLTRDHFFDADKIAGLTIDEQAKLHAAAHAGY